MNLDKLFLITKIVSWKNWIEKKLWKKLISCYHLKLYVSILSILAWVSIMKKWELLVYMLTFCSSYNLGPRLMKLPLWNTAGRHGRGKGLWGGSHYQLNSSPIKRRSFFCLYLIGQNQSHGSTQPQKAKKCNSETCYRLQMQKLGIPGNSLNRWSRGWFAFPAEKSEESFSLKVQQFNLTQMLCLFFLE